MTVKISSVKTTDFLDRWAKVPKLISACLFLLILVGSSLEKTLVDKKITVTEEEPVKVETITLQASKLGAFRIDVKTYIPLNQWISYEIKLVNKNGQLIASAIDQAWQGVQESDTLGGLDFRSAKTEKLDIFIEVLESGAVRGQKLNLRATFNVKVKNGVIDKSALWWALICNLGLAFLAKQTTKLGGQEVLYQTIKDSDPQGKATVGGENRLVRVIVNTKLDEKTPKMITIWLSIDNVYGERIYKESRSLPVSLIWNEDSATGGKGKLESFFILEPRNLYRFKVNVEPDAHVDWTSLVVKDDSKTLKAINVFKIIND